MGKTEKKKWPRTDAKALKSFRSKRPERGSSEIGEKIADVIDVN